MKTCFETFDSKTYFRHEIFKEYIKLLTFIAIRKNIFFLYQSIQIANLKKLLKNVNNIPKTVKKIYRYLQDINPDQNHRRSD
jgi:hypothetical protein